MKVDFYRHSLGAADAEGVARVLDTPFLTSGMVGKAVETQLSAFFEVPHALLMNSWTNGALATLLALGVGPGDEVIVPAMTFIATANVVELLGAKPVFIDVDAATLLITPAAVEMAITPRTKAVIAVHLYGQMCDMRALADLLADRPEIALLEDCAHCFEGRRDDYGPGQYSDAALFSFYATKNVTCGEGGAFATRRAELYEAVMRARLHGMSASAVDRYQTGGYRHWDMEVLGVKANLPDLLAVLLPRQIPTVRDRLSVRSAMAQEYATALAALNVRMPHTEIGVVHAQHLFPIHVHPRLRDEVIAGLNQRGVAVAINYRSVPTLTYYHRKYGYAPADFPVSYEWGEGTVTLPFFPDLSAEARAYVLASVADVIAAGATRH
ncbi:DegT/DnrJ/EryC1/StrS aminotransferase [Candidatus Accumulibacter aalborgensis]|uniref:DegT/DnrJ/EryC1/StrS aminotransferase n=1 Tax=Candidatus Accumulibacter aalborgensis TaxID=1860102 RepID=A0A1A8XKR8_9PROT|nr:DegT/DnrJ/EryC1/StrS aminotransferase family protein [Candidatus Accumulibacter aalborgensis]SBT04543.1 DegT/DnrJ/EryC1/StrS aminotransferase [Candidatus Accumulibacter aalborgensis]